MDIALYYAPITCALAPYITLTEAGATFEVRPLNFRKQEHMSADYMKINPKHKVPMLVVDGKTLTENVAIHQWIHRSFPQAKLLPADPWDELKAVSMLSWCSSGIHPFLSRINNPARVCDAPGAADSVRRFAAEGKGGTTMRQGARRRAMSATRGSPWARPAVSSRRPWRTLRGFRASRSRPARIRCSPIRPSSV